MPVLHQLRTSTYYTLLDATARAQHEAHIDALPDLLAQALTDAVEHRLRTFLNREFHEERAILYRVRGQVDMIRTERNQLLQQGRVACRFCTLTPDIVLNRCVLAALDRLRRMAASGQLIKRCQKLASAMARSGVSAVCPTSPQLRAVRLSTRTPDARKDALMFAAAQLVLGIPSKKSEKCPADKHKASTE